MKFLQDFYFLVFGFLIGSFLNVVILRLPLKKDIIYKRSGCPDCGHQLKWFHNIPIFSFIFLKGRCSFCANRISWRYPLIELAVGLIAYLLSPTEVNLYSIIHFIFYFAVVCLFICHFMIDLDHHLLLDNLNICLLIMFLLHATYFRSFYFWIPGGVIGFSFPLLVTWLFYKLRGQIGLGGGDIKLYGILGIFLGPMGVVFTIFMSCLLGAIWGLLMIMSKKMTKDKPMAFGPAILIVASFQIFFPTHAHILQSWFF
jgi:leader peptidase (prepilin peptidase)/N-methyltransferase